MLILLYLLKYLAKQISLFQGSLLRSFYKILIFILCIFYLGPVLSI